MTTPKLTPAQRKLYRLMKGHEAYRTQTGEIRVNEQKVSDRAIHALMNKGLIEQLSAYRWIRKEQS